MNGLELLKSIKAKFPGTIVILMTAYGTIDNAVAAMKAGAYDYFTNPFPSNRFSTQLSARSRSRICALRIVRCATPSMACRCWLPPAFDFAS